MGTRRMPAVLLAGVLLIAGCGGGPGSTADQPPEPAPSPAGLLTDLAAADEAAVASAVNGFGFDLFRAVAVPDENTVTSPLSAAVLLSMVLAGAEGETAAELAQVLRLADTRDVRMGELLGRLAETDEVLLETANGLWADPELPLHDDYLGFVRDTFNATATQADLGAPATAEAIDDWVADQTQGRIDGLAAELGLPDPDAPLVLLNTVYFLGEWETEFDPEQTGPRPFRVPGDETVEVPTMQLAGAEFGYAARAGYEVLRLPYGADGRYGMEIFLPAPATPLSDLVGDLDQDEWREAVTSLAPRTVDLLALPRFQLEWGAPLDDALVEMGLASAFTPYQADFSGMSPAELYLATVVQKTFIQVDEAGTEAAAATGGSMGVTAAEPELRFEVDRPFAVTISDQQTGTILFLGAVTDPRG
ncbi:serpin family protein [Natronosporangium hydrolyticum]|uniref:Serpin family protein n=1 Tax=Natronosporangium hydrolyticum TaxID=2811111 RepID=A0A895YIE5_9ACTN|nr:serpin family protein [Natronosporangium hydrolyticum]QSB15785.1 serpin family protein [Natronosporangium hydrolyticum]